MSELGNKIKSLRADQPQVEFAEKAGLSLRTICKLEAGETVRLDTVRQVARALKLSEEERLELIVLWLKLEVGDDFHKLDVELKDRPATARDTDYLPAKIQVVLRDAPRKYQEQIYLALQRPEVLRCLPALNELYDTLRKNPEA